MTKQNKNMSLNINRQSTLCLFLLFACLNTTNTYSQENVFFKENELITTGVYYYPEHWPENQWERDIKNIANAGFEFIHMAEFAWVFMEPEEGRFEFEWLDKAIALAGKNGLKVILSTPPACPPAWLSVKHPEIYKADDNYQFREHGARANYSASNEVFRKYLKKIVAKLGERYGKNPHVMGWQLDNEPNGYKDYSESAQKAFRAYLKQRYKTIDSLNYSWGNRFWGILYHDFEQIRIPITRTLWGVSPTTLLDYHRFVAWKQAEFLDAQALELRKYINENQWITTNYIKHRMEVDPYRTKHLDFSSYTIYPVNGSTYNLGDKGFRIGEYNTLSYANDYFRSINGTTGVMELQPGQVNWGKTNPIPAPGAVRMWLWHAYSGGCAFACTYRYRQPLYGSEQYHYGIVGTDGLTLTSGGKEYTQFISEINQIRKIYQKKAYPEKLSKRKTAILWERDNYWDAEIQKRSNQWDTWKHMLKYMEIVKSFGCPLDYITEKNDFAQYPFLIVPAYQMIDKQLVERWEEYALNGGNLIITCRTGQKNRNSHLWEAKWAEPIYNLIGGEIEAYDLLLPNITGHVEYAGEQYQWNNWGDLINPYNETNSLAVYSDQFYAGKTSITTRKSGKGTVTYIGVDTDDGLLETEILTKIFSNAKVEIAHYPKGVYVEYQKGFWIAVNYSSNDYVLQLPKNADIIFGKKVLTSPGVTVWTVQD